MSTSSPRWRMMCFLGTLFACGIPLLAQADLPKILKATPLSLPGDPADAMLTGIDRFMDAQLISAAKARRDEWAKRTPDENRRLVAQSIGLRDERPKAVELELIAAPYRTQLLEETERLRISAVRWRAFGDVYAEGLMLDPAGPVRAEVIALPDADQTPEMLAGLAPGIPPEAQFARRLAESGCRVIVPVLLDRHVEKRLAPGRTDGPELSNRDFVQRAAWMLGRHVVGYEVQKVMAAIDYIKTRRADLKIGVIGYGEGGMVALYAAALDTRIDAACVSGYFGQHENVWKEPFERTVFGQVQRFNDAELSLLILPRALGVEACPGPKIQVKGKGAAPAVLDNPAHPRAAFEALLDATKSLKDRALDWHTHDGAPGSKTSLDALLLRLGIDKGLAPIGPAPGARDNLPDPAARQQRQLHELVRHNEQLLASSADVRKQFMKKLDTSSPAKYETTSAAYREIFDRDILGRFDLEPLAPNPRARKLYDTPTYTGWEICLDVFPDVFAFGILLLPKDLKEGEKRPVVVCQHGLEGRPQDCITGGNRAYHDYAAKLCERGYIVFAPQNPYLMGDRFRTIVRKAWPLGKTLWSIIIPQHRQILKYLKSLACVDPQRIAFYGLSYGGKTAMRVPAVLTDYCLSICSADFNEWVFKNASTKVPWSYLYTGEYEIFEWDLGNTFNYAEMAALIAPRPFMVERGHFDGVSSDEYVAFEFAKVRNLYNARLKLQGQCEIEWFPGPHEIHAKGTFEFLDKHLKGAR